MYEVKREKLDEQGFAAIIIAIILVLVLSLITVGFAALMRNEQRSALDRQLSNAAYYAAESGVNDAAAAVRAGYTKEKTLCGTNGVDMALAGHDYLTDMSVDSTNGTEYTCLLIDPSPSNLEYSSIDAYKATTTVITGADPASGADKTISKLVFSWQNKDGSSKFRPSGLGTSQLPPVNQWKVGPEQLTGILRTSVTPLSSLQRSSLIGNRYTAYMYPLSGSVYTLGATYPGSLPTSSYSGNTGNAGGAIVGGQCNQNSKPQYCAAVVTNLSQATYLLHLSAIYADLRVTVTAYDSSNNVLSIKGAQTLVDSTGKAQDVLRRIQVRVPLQKSYDYPEFDLVTGSTICKQLSTYPANKTIQSLNAAMGAGNTTLGPGCSTLAPQL